MTCYVIKNLATYVALWCANLRINNSIFAYMTDHGPRDK